MSFFLVSLGTLCLLLAATGDLIPLALFGNDFSGLGQTLLYLALGLTAGALGMVAGNGIWAMDRPALNVWADVTSLAVTVGAGFLWIPSQAALGAAKAVLAGAVSAAMIRWLICAKLLRQRTRDTDAPDPGPRRGDRP